MSLLWALVVSALCYVMPGRYDPLYLSVVWFFAGTSVGTFLADRR